MRIGKTTKEENRFSLVVCSVSNLLDKWEFDAPSN